MIDSSTINEIRNSLDIVEVISSYISLKPKGKNYFGVCPFHDDHSPSMSVSREKQIYTCFSCGATGNVFKFIQDYENISFIEAVKKCSQVSGISIGNINVSKKNKHQELYDIYELSQKFYQNNINTKLGEKAKKYLYDRKLNDEVIKEFQIGLSLDDNKSLVKLLKSKKYNDDILIKSGLINENNYELNDVYKNRIMFPLYDLNGNIIGYNGRVYNGEKENKYINSKETEIFKKRELLYNYHRSKDFCRTSHQVIVMEGPMDIIRAYTIGVKNCVAILGTAFTKEQAMLIRKLSDNVILCFDGDAAGLKATKLAIEELTKLGITPKVVRLEDNSDPDEYIIKRGKDAFLNKINSPMSIMDFKESLLKVEYNLNNTEDTAKYINNMIVEINNIDDDILKELTINKLSKETGIDTNIIKGKLTKKEPVRIIEKNTVSKKMNKYEKSQIYLLYYMLISTDVIKMYQNKITKIPNDKYRNFAYQIEYFYKINGYINVADFISLINNEDDMLKVLSEITSLNLKNEINFDEIEDYINNIREYNEKEKIKKIKSQLRDETDFNKRLELANEAIKVKLRSEDNDR